MKVHAKVRMKIRLVRPAVKYMRSFLKLAREFRKERSKYQNHLKYEAEGFPEFVKIEKGWAFGRHMPGKDFVPGTVYWLARDRRILGVGNLRHRLNKRLRRTGGHIGYKVRPPDRGKGYGTKLLSLLLSRARKLGLKRVLVTCDRGNVASRKIIERNGGIYSGKAKNSKGDWELRYWINLR
jgi:predicted acetyltransferase